MSGTKRGEVAVLLTLVLLILAGAVFFLGKEGITGAAIGLPEETINQSNNTLNNVLVEDPLDSSIINNRNITNNSIDIPIMQYFLNESFPNNSNSNNSNYFIDNNTSNSPISFDFSKETPIVKTLNDSLNNFISNSSLVLTQLQFLSVVANGTQCGTVNGNISLRANLVPTESTCFDVNASNIIIDGRGFNITGQGNGTGIDISLHSFDEGGFIYQNVTIINFGGINNFSYGIYSIYTHNLSIMNNTIAGNGVGIGLMGDVFGYTNHTNISSNIIARNGVGLDIGDYYFPINGYTKIVYNNITYNGVGVSIDNPTIGTNLYINISYNNIINKLNFLRPVDNVYGNEGTLNMTQNYWGAADCSNATTNNSGVINVFQIDPILNGPFFSGSVVACPSQYCGKLLFTSINLTDNLINCGGDGFVILDQDVVLDCKDYFIGTNSNNNGTGILIGTGVSEYQGNRSNISNCRINGFRRGIAHRSANANIVNNTITNSSLIGLSVGHFYVTSASYSDTYKHPKGNVFNNTILFSRSNDFFSAGLHLDSTAQVVVQSNNVSNNLRGIIVNSTASSFLNNFLINNSYGYSLRSSNTSFYSDSVINSSVGIIIESSAVNHYNYYFYNTLLSNNSYDLAFINASFGNTTFVNATINKSKMFVPLEKVFIRWFVDVNVTDTDGLPISNVTVISVDGLGQFDDSNTTNSLGISRLKVTEFYRKDQTNFYVTPGIIKVQKVNYTSNSTTLDMTNLNYAVVTLKIKMINCGDTITQDFTFSSNFNCPSGFVIGQDNIIMDGNWFNLSSDGTGIGFNISNHNNITIQKVGILKYNTGIILDNANLSTVTNVRIVNNTVGLNLRDSFGNLFYNTIIGNNTNISIYSSSDNFPTNNSFINLSYFNINNISVNSLSSIYLKSYIPALATFNGKIILKGATFNAYINYSGILDDSKMTDSNGQVIFELTEIKKNTTDISYVTPHNFSLVYLFQNNNFTNSTVVNITPSTNKNINLSLVLNCTVPNENGMTLYNDTTFCPSNFALKGTIDLLNNVTVTCVNTIFSKGNNNALFRISSLKNITIKDCTFDKVDIPIQISSSYINFTHVNLTNSLISCYNANNINIQHSFFNGLQGFSSYYCSNIKIYNNTFRGTNAISLRESQNNTIYNNSFIGLTRAILMTSAYDSILSDNNTFYYNNFSQTILYHFDYTAISTYNNQFNTTSGNLTQGNTYSDYCDKGTDINNDGYADASSGATVNWPYSENISTKISATGSSVVDYGPRIINCPPSEVYLSTVTSSTISTNAAVSGGSAPAAPAAAPPAFAATTASSGSSAPYSPADIKKYLKSESLQTKQTDGITTVTFTLENTGTQPMQLFPNILQEVDDPFFIVTRKTLGGENSKFTEIAHLSYSDTPVAGRLLKATIVNPADIVLQPGEKTEKTIEIKEGLAIPRQLKIQFTTLGESVLEKEIKVEKKVVSGTAVDVDTENHLLDIYAVLVPEKALMQKNGNGITGAAIGIPTKNSGAYYLEFSMDDNKTGTTAFTDLYGPYNLKQGQSFIFAQQLKYDPQYYAGNYVVKTKIIREDATLVKNELPIELGALLKQKDSFSEWFYLFFFLFLSGGLVIGLYLIYWQHRKSY